MRDVTIAQEKLDTRRGRDVAHVVAHVAGVDAEGELVFTHRGHAVISADHTGVPDTLAGQGAKPPEWADLFVTRPGEEP